MRQLGLLATGMLLAGAVAAGAQDMGYGGEWKLGVGGITSASQRDAYHMGYGMDAVAAYERAYGQTDSRIGVRGSYLNYELDEGALLPDNFQEYSAALEALVGPALGAFEPKIGGHVGYVRQDGAGDDNDLLDVGGDVMASVEATKGVEFNAVVTPLWLIDDDDTDYQTRGAINVQFAIPGA